MADELHWSVVRSMVKSGVIIRKDKKHQGKSIYGAFPSKPGQPPHKQTGNLRRSVTYEIVDVGGQLRGRVGTNEPYGKFLELGTAHMKPRPWLRRALAEKRAEVTAILSRPITLPSR